MRGSGQAGRRATQPYLKPSLVHFPCTTDDLSHGTLTLPRADVPVPLVANSPRARLLRPGARLLLVGMHVVRVGPPAAAVRRLRAQPLPRAARVLPITRPPHWPVREPLCCVLRVGAPIPVGVSKNLTTSQPLLPLRPSSPAQPLTRSALRRSSLAQVLALRRSRCPPGAPSGFRLRRRCPSARAFLPRPSDVLRHSELGCSQLRSEQSLGPLIGNRRSWETEWLGGATRPIIFLACSLHPRATHLSS